MSMFTTKNESSNAWPTSAVRPSATTIETSASTIGSDAATTRAEHEHEHDAARPAGRSELALLEVALRELVEVVVERELAGDRDVEPVAAVPPPPPPRPRRRCVLAVGPRSTGTSSAVRSGEGRPGAGSAAGPASAGGRTPAASNWSRSRTRAAATAGSSTVRGAASTTMTSPGLLGVREALRDQVVGADRAGVVGDDGLAGEVVPQQRAHGDHRQHDRRQPREQRLPGVRRAPPRQPFGHAVLPPLAVASPARAILTDPADASHPPPEGRSARALGRPSDRGGRQLILPLTLRAPRECSRMQEAEKIWMNGALVDWADARVHVLSHGLHYGTTVFEGIRAYDAEEGTAVFRLDDHLARLERSAAMYHMPHPVHAGRAARRRSTRSSRPTASAAATSARSCCAATAPWASSRSRPRWTWPSPPGSGAPTSARRASARASAPRSRAGAASASSTIPATAKAGGQYLNSILAKIETHKAGYQEAILLNEAGFVADGSGENIFVVRDGVLFTPPLQASILEGITRARS